MQKSLGINIHDVL